MSVVPLVKLYEMNVEDIYDVLRRAKYYYGLKYISVTVLKKLAEWLKEKRPEIQDMKAYMEAINSKGKKDSEQLTIDFYNDLHKKAILYASNKNGNDRKYSKATH